jgi:uncharacterized membrane protein
MLYPVRTLSIGIDRPYAAVAKFLAEPLNYPKWATGLSTGIARDEAASQWVAQTPHGRAVVRFTPANDFGVADHWVSIAGGNEIYIPLRSVANARGAQVSLTLFRLAEMDDAQFDADSNWVERDLAKLKAVLESL